MGGHFTTPDDPDTPIRRMNAARRRRRYQVSNRTALRLTPRGWVPTIGNYDDNPNAAVYTHSVQHPR